MRDLKFVHDAIPRITGGIKQWSTRVLIPFARVGNPSDRGEDLTVNNSAKVYMRLQALICFSLTAALFFLYFKEYFKSSIGIDFFFCAFLLLNLALLLLVRIK